MTQSTRGPGGRVHEVETWRTPNAGASQRASRDPDGSLARFQWDFGDRTSGTGRVPTHTYRSPGRYFVTLTVTDAAGARDAFVNVVR